MILGKSLDSLEFKLNACGGGGGGGGGDAGGGMGTSPGSVGDPGSPGAGVGGMGAGSPGAGGAAAAGGMGGAGDPGDSSGGGIGGGTSGGIGPGMAAAAAAGAGMSEGEVAAAMGDTGLGEAIGGMTSGGGAVDAGITPLADIPASELASKAQMQDAAFAVDPTFDEAMKIFDVPLALKTGLSILGMPVVAAQMAASAMAALTGNLGMADAEAEAAAEAAMGGGTPGPDRGGSETFTDRIKTDMVQPTMGISDLITPEELPKLGNIADPFAPTEEDEDLMSWYDDLTADYRKGVTWASFRSGQMSDPEVYTPTLY